MSKPQILQQKPYKEFIPKVETPEFKYELKAIKECRSEQHPRPKSIGRAIGLPLKVYGNKESVNLPVP